MTGFGSFDNSTCRRVLDLLEPGDLRLGQIVIKRVAVVKLGMNNGRGDMHKLLRLDVVLVCSPTDRRTRSIAILPMP